MRTELTIRALLLGAAITLVFTAANVYLGLKVGLTFASSIPAAVISMAILRGFKNSTIFENNIVQTVASAAGTLSSIIFVLPGLVMVGWWSGFPFWESFGVCVVGGVLGVMYTIPLRRALVSESDLPYPEGVAAAEILRVGVGSRTGASEGKSGFFAVLAGAIASALFAIITATRVFIGEIDAFFRVGPAATGIGFSLSLALFGAGHLVGLSVGLAILAGIVIAWGIATPILTALHPVAGPAIDVATHVWSHQVRFIGAGAIGVSAVWTLGKLAVPVWRGLISAMEASSHRAAGKGTLPRTEHDIPIGIVGLTVGACIIPLAALLIAFLYGGPLSSSMVLLAGLSIFFIIVVGFLVAAVCGYMAGLIGSSNSPVSGLAILTVIGAALLLAAFAHGMGDAAKPALVAFALFVTAIVLCIATIANDNLQDLKTGQLVNATPWRQQVALIVGVVFGSLVIPPILGLLNGAYGFAGSPIVHAGAQPLPAPQATLISALANGVISGKLDWSLIGIGALVGVGIIIIDEVLRANGKMKLPPLAVGLGIYLPASTTVVVVLGAVAGALYDRWVAKMPDGEIAKRLGVLLASGLIVGESLVGVVMAGLIVASGKASPIALVGDGFGPASIALGGVAFVVTCWRLYVWISTLHDDATQEAV